MIYANIIETIEGWSMKTPHLYGWFHILFLLLTIGTTIYLCLFYRDASTRTMKIICIVCEVILVVLEIIKQFVNSYENGVFKYDWSSFPFQFCETPMYVLPVIAINKNKKVQDVLIAYMGTFAMFAGLCIMICPITVLNSSIFSNIRALVQHGIQVVIGIYLMAWNRKNYTIRNFLYSVFLFMGLCCVAITINFIVEAETGAEMSMFYLTKYHESAILFVRVIKPYVPFVVYVLAYVVGFTGCAFLSLIVENAIYKACLNKNNKQSHKMKAA